MERIIIKLPVWFIKKKRIERLNKETVYHGWIVRETEKAILFKMSPILATFIYYSHMNSKQELWIPKSIIEVISRG